MNLPGGRLRFENGWPPRGGGAQDLRSPLTDGEPAGHVRLVLRVLRSCGEKDITLDYESRDWGFKSLRERAGSASSMGEHLVHTQGTEVRFLR